MTFSPPESRRAQTSRLFGVLLVILAVLTVARFAYQEQQNATFQSCVSELATTMIARSDAAERERMALRGIIGQIGKPEPPDPAAVELAYNEYQRAIQNADSIRRSTNGSMTPITDCVDK